jgi:predicted alpha/beta hydrolase family esterase
MGAAPQVQNVMQHNWEQPQLTQWLATLNQRVSLCQQDVIFVAHSLGCILLLHWLRAGCPGLNTSLEVSGVLLVAPPDAERRGFPAADFAPVPQIPLQLPVKCLFRVMIRGVMQRKLGNWAEKWQFPVWDVGNCGHINSESGLGWDAGWQIVQEWLDFRLTTQKRHFGPFRCNESLTLLRTTTYNSVVLIDENFPCQ